MGSVGRQKAARNNPLIIGRYREQLTFCTVDVDEFEDGLFHSDVDGLAEKCEPWATWKDQILRAASRAAPG